MQASPIQQRLHSYHHHEPKHDKNINTEKHQYNYHIHTETLQIGKELQGCQS